MCKCFLGMCFFRLPEIWEKIYIYKFKYHHSTMKCRDIYNIFQHQYHGIATAKRSIKNGEIWSYIILYIYIYFHWDSSSFSTSFFLCCWCLFMFNQTFICKYLFPLSPWNIVQFLHSSCDIREKKFWLQDVKFFAYKLHFFLAILSILWASLSLCRKTRRKHVNHFLK